MFPSQQPLAVPRDQFTHHRSPYTRRSPRWSQLLLLLPGALTGLAAGWVQPPMTQVAPGLLTATSILTGFTFAMATTFWNKSIDARRDPRWATSTDVLDLLDNARTHLTWTVFVGVISVAVLALFSLFGHSEVQGWLVTIMAVVTRAGSGLAGFLVVYLITLVAAALKTFNEAVAVLKA